MPCCRKGNPSVFGGWRWCTRPQALGGVASRRVSRRPQGLEGSGGSARRQAVLVDLPLGEIEGAGEEIAERDVDDRRRYVAFVEPVGGSVSFVCDSQKFVDGDGRGDRRRLEQG